MSKFVSFAKRNSLRFVALVLSLIAAVYVASPALSVYAVTYGDIKNSETEEMRLRLEKLKAESAALESKINEAEKSKEDALKCKELYDSMHNVYVEQLSLLEDQRNDLGDELAKCEEDAKTLEAEYEQSYENFLGLLRMTYEEGSSNYLAIILGAEDLGDLLSRVERVSGMIGYNKRLMKRVEKAKTALEAKKAELEESRVKVDEAAAKVNEKEKELEELDAKNEAMLATLEAQIKQDQAAADKLKAERDSANKAFDSLVSQLIAEEAERQRQLEEKLHQERLAEEERKRLELERAQQEEMERENQTQDYTWPLPTRYRTITSWFNEDRNLQEIGYRDTHGGMDIAAPNRTPIYAVKTGRVILSGVVSGYGNCVMIDHGDGVVSIYGHASQLLCKTGDIVKKGQTIALVGLTGITTGYHLHIEFRKNGKRVEPLNYISIPKG